MQKIITDPRLDPMGQMIVDYLNGRTQARVEVFSPHLEMGEMTGEMLCRPFVDMSAMEQDALSRCRGRILDVGAGSGCHSLWLQDRGEDVSALEISPGCIRAMEKQGVNTILYDSFFRLKTDPFDTILMLMNGIGLCGTLEGVKLFFQHLPQLLDDQGQVLVDSTDLGAYAPVDSPEDPEDSEPGLGFWETQFSVTYGGLQSPDFDWIYMDFETLSYHADLHGFQCRCIHQGERGKYLARIRRKS